MKFYFLNTCYASPEQYDVYRANGELCGYVRLRWGALRADYPNIEGDSIYTKSFNDDFKGMFENDEERNHYLTEIALVYQHKILEGIPSNVTDEDMSYEILTDPSELEERLKNV